jgi:hypothetical protein
VANDKDGGILVFIHAFQKASNVQCSTSNTELKGRGIELIPTPKFSGDETGVPLRFVWELV